jgi:hypothetical protein
MHIISYISVFSSGHFVHTSGGSDNQLIPYGLVDWPNQDATGSVESVEQYHTHHLCDFNNLLME